MEILKTLSKPKCCISLEELSNKTKMSLPLISYHINGNLKSEGLKDMGLVDTNEKKGRIEINLSTLGRMLLRGYVS
jgi:DNA-binding transcriptional ArsR family regulator